MFITKPQKILKQTSKAQKKLVIIYLTKSYFKMMLLFNINKSLRSITEMMHNDVKQADALKNDKSFQAMIVSGPHCLKHVQLSPCKIGTKSMAV
jgi:hypothetical protein